MYFTKQAISSRTHKDPDDHLCLYITFPGIQLCPSSEMNHSPIPLLTEFDSVKSFPPSSSGFYATEDCQFLPKGNGQNKNTFSSPVLQKSLPFLLQVQQFLMCSPIQCIHFPLPPIPILFFPASCTLLAPFPQKPTIIYSS